MIRKKRVNRRGRIMEVRIGVKLFKGDLLLKG